MEHVKVLFLLPGFGQSLSLELGSLTLYNYTTVDHNKMSSISGPKFIVIYGADLSDIVLTQYSLFLKIKGF